MPAKINKPNAFHFKLLPAFADYLLKNKLRDFTKIQLDITFNVDFPVLKYYDLSMYSEEQLIDISIPAYTEFLTAISKNNLEAFITESIKKWEANQLPNITRDQLVTKDITLATYIRKQALFTFIPEYTSDVITAIELTKEIENYGLESLSRTFNTYININTEKLNDINYVLKEHERELLEAQEILGFGSFEWNVNDDQSSYTPQLFKILEIDKVGKLTDFFDFVHPADRDKLKKAIDTSLTTGEDFECEYRYRKNDKEKVLWSKGVVINKDNKPALLKGTVMDITERHYILQRLERNEELYKQAQKLTHIGNWLWDFETDKVKFSDEFYRIYGLNSKEEISFEHFMSFVHIDDKEKVMAQITNSIKTHQPHTIDYRLIRVDGTERVIRRNAEVLLDEKGKPYKIAGTGQDITKEVLLNKEIKDRENQLADLNVSLGEKNVALERSNKELTSFSYVASHDLQEPLRKIKTFTNIILEKEKNISTEGKEYFDRIMVSTNRMQKLIEDLLSFSRTQIYENTLQEVDLNTLVLEIKNLHAETISEGKMIIECGPLPIIHAVLFQMQQLFENIISNSIKYGQPNKITEIQITCILVKGKDLKFTTAQKNKNYYKMVITDNGIGFDQKYSEKIFEIFQRLHGKSEYSGTGIGLSICKKIVENHHGFITAHSKINEGATFEIYLPVDDTNLHLLINKKAT